MEEFKVKVFDELRLINSKLDALTAKSDMIEIGAKQHEADVRAMIEAVLDAIKATK